MNFNNLNWQPPTSYSEPNSEAIKALEQESSTMTREEARQIIAAWLAKSKGEEGKCGYIEGWFYEKDVEAFRMAIDALEQELSEDCISREQIIEAHYEWCNQHQGENDVFHTWSLELMKNAQSVVPSRAEGG